jgi:uncharacterized membrane protein YraQ (UPF0718 family)
VVGADGPDTDRPAGSAPAYHRVAGGPGVSAAGGSADQRARHPTAGPVLDHPIADHLPAAGAHPRGTAGDLARSGREPLTGSVVVLAVVLLAAVAVRAFSGGLVVPGAVAAGTTVFVSIVVQALPFLVLGTLISAAITAFVPASTVGRLLPRRAVFVAACREDLVQAGGFLVLGAATAAVLNVALPPGVLRAVAGNPVLAVLALALLAVLLSLCSQADAFVISAMTQFSLTARLVFLVVGPLVDVKLFALQAGTFGRRFAIRFAPATFVVAVLAGLAAGAVLL